MDELKRISKSRSYTIAVFSRNYLKLEGPLGPRILRSVCMDSQIIRKWKWNSWKLKYEVTNMARWMELYTEHMERLDMTTKTYIKYKELM